MVDGTQAAGLAIEALNIANRNTKAFRNQGWSVISTVSNNFAQGQGSTAYTSITSRMECVTSASPVTDVRVVFGNYLNANNYPETPNTNDLLINCWLSYGVPGSYTNVNGQGAIVTFNGKRNGRCEGTQLLYSDDIYFPVPPYTRFFIQSTAFPVLLAGPSAPACAGSGSGGTLSAGTYQVSCTTVYADGSESLASPSTAVVTTGSTSSITVQSPTAIAGAIGYRVYLSAVNGATSGQTAVQYINSGLVAYGTTYVITTSFSSDFMIRNVGYGVGSRIPVGSATLGGPLNSTGGCANGEGAQPLKDWSYLGAFFSVNTTTSTYSPVAVMGKSPSGLIPSVALIGDSKMALGDDYAYGPNRGSAYLRAFNNETAQYVHDLNFQPYCGHVMAACPSDSAAAFANFQKSAIRRQLASLCTHAISNYGVNDLGSTSASGIVLNNATIATWFINAGMPYYQCTLDPDTKSTDFFQTIANQTNTMQGEMTRRSYNNCLLNSGGAFAVVGENLGNGSNATFSPASGLNYNGDGATTIFLSINAFLQGSEQIRVAGVLKTAGVDYTYLNAHAINGSTYANGVTFTVAPANGATVVANYTSIPGFVSLVNALADITGIVGIINTAAAIEVNAAGVYMCNGGWWRPAYNAPAVTGTSSGGNTTLTLNDTSQTWTANQWLGWTVNIISDPGNPTCTGASNVVLYNSATQINFFDNWPGIPSNSAQYQIAQPATREGIHETTPAAIDKAKAIPLNLFTV